MKKIILLTLSFLLLISFSNINAQVSEEALDKTYPNRKFYPQLQYISTEQMTHSIEMEKYFIIDARPQLPFESLHIKGAINIHSGDKSFNEKFLTAINNNSKPIVFYCGGLACLKSYKASVKAIDLLRKNNIALSVYTYDSGISAFAHANPKWVLKNGKDISPDNPLLDIAEIKKHAISAQNFTDIIRSDESDEFVILDIRESNQKILRKLFMFKKEKKLTLLKPEKLIVFLNDVKKEGKTLMVYGSVEKQIESLYPLIKMSGQKKWFYLEGGEHAYSQYMIKQYVK
ncbi:MAG: rhodanese-like domain-containing protein [Gammaproteobacteria bacterium]|nr:rhodanese-like domain-containing protein [Gammaproteobacteria bacterium]